MEMDTEIRFLRPSDRRRLIEMLDTGNHWRQFASVLPKPDSKEGYLLTSKNMQLLEDLKSQVNGSPTKALLDYWGTSGRKRPTIKDLLETLIACRFYKAADFVSVSILGREPVPRDIDDAYDDASADERMKPNLNIPSNHFESVNSSSSTLNYEETVRHFPKLLEVKTNLSPVQSTSDVTSLSVDDNSLNYQVKLMLKRGIRKYNHEDLASGTDNFNALPISKGGNKLGEGAYGIVFLGKDTSGNQIAVKCVRDEYGKQFLSELDVLTRFSHENLLTLLGIACSGINLFLVYEFMVNGSLGDRLMCLNSTRPIPWETRKAIAIGSARGLGHLHANSYIHRDIKSANILLDYDWTPKLGDFGLARTNLGNSQSFNSQSQVNFTSTIIGTSIYMAPESFRGQLTPKMDIYSFGIVLLELLTGLSPFDENREGGDILSWSQIKIDIESNDDLTIDLLQPFLDSKAGPWDTKCAVEMMKLSRSATEYDKKDRPTIEAILDCLSQL